MRRFGVPAIIVLASLGGIAPALRGGAMSISGCAERAREPAGGPQRAEPRGTGVAEVRAEKAQAEATSAPPVRLFARRFVVRIRQAPDKASFRLGYLRGGAVLSAKTAAPIGYAQCRRGWYELDTGGFLCSTVDALVFTGNRLPERQARQPDLSAPLPYPYGYSRRRNTAMYRRLPSDEEAVVHEAEPAPGQPAAALALNAAPATAIAAAIEPAADESEAIVPAGTPGEGEPSVDAGVPTLASLLGEQGSVLMRRMERGFYVSLDREMTRGARNYWRTQANGFIPSAGLRLVEGRDFHGVQLAPQGLQLPLGFVTSNKSSAYVANGRGRLRHAASAPAYHESFAIASEAEIGGRRYLVAADGRHVPARDVARIDRREKPAEVGAAEKWIDVDLAAQSLVAHVGAEPVFATLISSGRIKDELDTLKNFQTPTGAFRITSKHLTATMDGDHAIDGPYSIEDVPYVMYFELAFALHAAFWHNSFGRPRSHGCINLAPLDAKWLFEFAEPALPRIWHGVYPTEQVPGTRLYIHGETPVR